MASFHLARSLGALRAQANARWPGRDRTSDGWIGDTSHAARASDHNPDWDALGARAGIVRAYDLDEDLDGNGTDRGAELRWWVDWLVATRDPRVAYLIYEGQIVSSTVRPWQWRPYTGPNAHTKHVHVSILHTVAAENDTRPWFPAAPVEDDMPYTEAQLEQINRRAMAKELTTLGSDSRTAIGKMIDGAVARVLTGVSTTEVDEAEVARLVLAGLDPAAIAAAIPETLAGDVADELAGRLAG